jgi:hypothetical protein
VSLTASAQAAPVDDETRATARVIAQEGLDFYDKGRYGEALDRLERANKLVEAPTLTLMIARCLQKLGRLVEASERYLEVTRTKLDMRASDLFKKAVIDATKEREALMPMIPTVTVVVEGAGPGDVAVTLDGKLVPPALIGVKRLINPGKHRIEARQGELSDLEEISLATGESKTVTLALKPPPKAPVKVEARGSGGTQRILGFIGIGVGGAGVVTGIVTGGLAASKGSDLEAKGCVEGHCLKSLRGEVATYNTLRVVSSVGIFAGAALAAGGVVLLLTAPKGASDASGAPGTEQARVEPFIGVGSAGVRGTF